ncbi:hypothetical protein ILUMI_10095 [Ignelater luminosus]|uniref:Proteasome assembly chaperone 3 n=1 Tax=Ignelater luminosus TaxID=2038154 RepID=A0A8K0CYR6_IGNLU|nr:hypothetical protein ILUMI_10095 [Ignelater luminosus]
MALVSLIRYLQSVKPRALVTRAFQTVINDNPTEIIYNEYVSYHLIVAKQVGGDVTACKVIPADDPSVEPKLSVIEIGGNGDIKYGAELLAEMLNIKKTLLLFFCLKDYENETIMTCIEALKNEVKV